ncbi:MAG: heavy metal-associated domain-containing protein [Phycisphaerales bacterium]|jgi:copper chaperone CopZ|nr:heavy metal-associated domain-containing protein [Phycisphaerales bacterium]MDP6890753.1 heavy metal-associated domain-containing protein [Phycisphaerales bacterium]
MIIRVLLGTITAVLVACERPADSADGPSTVTHGIGDRVVLAVSGMHCGNCERAIEQGLMSCDGVNDVAASAADQEVVVWIDTGTDHDVVRAKIATLGFKVERPQTN